MNTVQPKMSGSYCYIYQIYDTSKYCNISHSPWDCKTNVDTSATAIWDATDHWRLFVHFWFKGYVERWHNGKDWVEPFSVHIRRYVMITDTTFRNLRSGPYSGEKVVVCTAQFTFSNDRGMLLYYAFSTLL